VATPDLPPEIREGRSDEREVFRLINALRRRSTGTLNAPVWVSTATAELPGAVDMGALGSGILYQTVAAGVSTPAIVTIGSGLSFTGGTLSAPAVAATYITQTPSADLANEQALSLLATGLLKSTTGTGVISIAAAGTDYEVPLTFSTGLTRTVNTITANLSTGIAGGQSVIGGTAASENLTYSSTTNGTKGKHIWGSTTGLVFNESTNVTSVGIASPASNTFLHYKYNDNSGSNLYIHNPSTSTNTYAGLTIGNTDAIFVGGSYWGFWKYGPNVTTSGFRAAGTAQLQLAGGTGNIHHDLFQNTGDHIWTTTTSQSERMRVANGGNVSIANLTAGGVVYATAATGVLKIGTAAEVASAITWPAADQILYSSSTTTAPLGDSGFTWDTGFDTVSISGGASWAHYNLGSSGGGTYERVRAYWSSDIWTLGSESSGGTVRNMVIQSDTATLTLSGGGGAYLVGGAVGSAPSWLASSLKLFASPITSRTSAVGATLDAVHVSGVTISVTSNNSINTATGFNYVTIDRPTFNGTGGAKSIINSATVYIQNCPTFSGDISAITNAYSLWIDAGKSRFDGDGTHVFELPADATGNTSAAVGRIPCQIGGSLRYLRYYTD